MWERGGVGKGTGLNLARDEITSPTTSITSSEAISSSSRGTPTDFCQPSSSRACLCCYCNGRHSYFDSRFKVIRNHNPSVVNSAAGEEDHERGR
ncbi:hypothetical protein Pcinc_035876 [Petrolisthes cinctipes]|uniref:Uncharacterized protein n=1 Tax=Petrolisthes cinctipes TaxID=88211 RepID=A0AAE1BXD6_PETCI|nr:hypothetical protein Pcinc_035876 [Petrolisthes cinctipes]